MKLKMTEISEKAAQIIMNNGLENLTIKNLASQLKTDINELHKMFSKEDDILLMMFNNFEKDFIEFINELRNHNEAPEKEFRTFFKSLYNVFLQKPYYLSIIFDKRLKKRDDKIKMSILRMRDIVDRYLTRLIDAGKKNNAFKTNASTKLLVDKMLVEFRLLMRDEQYINEMILELESLRKSKD